MLISVGYTNGLVVINHFKVDYTEDGFQTIQFVSKHNLWDEEDEISVTNLSYIKTKVYITFLICH